MLTSTSSNPSSKCNTELSGQLKKNQRDWHFQEQIQTYRQWSYARIFFKSVAEANEKETYASLRKKKKN